MFDEEYFITNISDADKKEIEVLASKNNGNKNLTEAFINHWYFDNPSHSFSICKVVVNDTIEGFATTNNFKYIINSEVVNVAMPQNVLTSEKIRGKGLFNKLYFNTERENITDNNVTAFFTFTNELSTPIFLIKFNYIKGKCPVMIFKPISIISLLKKKNYERLNSVNEIDGTFFQEKFILNNSMQKNEAYYKWRYAGYLKEKLHVIKVFNKGEIYGFAFLKEEKKRGLKFLIVMDMLFINPDYISMIAKTCFTYSAKKMYAGTLMFELPIDPISNNLFQFKIKNRFNFLVKGKDIYGSQMLAAIDFNMFFGDLDIV